MTDADKLYNPGSWNSLPNQPELNLGPMYSNAVQVHSHAMSANIAEPYDYHRAEMSKRLSEYRNIRNVMEDDLLRGQLLTSDEREKALVAREWVEHRITQLVTSLLDYDMNRTVQTK